MSNIYAICPFCDKSILVEENSDGEYFCAACGHALNADSLRERGLIIDVAEADAEYTRAQQYFVNTDFKGAGIHFKKVLEYNRNHYLASYYASLCDIYENEEKPEFNVSFEMIKALKDSIEKLGLCQTNVQARIGFLSSVLNQAHIILTAHFNGICENYEHTEQWDNLRDKCLNIATNIKEITNIDKEKLLVFDSSISKSLIALADLAICSCQKVVQSHMTGESKLDLPTTYQYERAKALYGLFIYYATSLDPSYNINSYNPDYTANLLFNESVISKLNRYNSENRIAQKKFLSTPGQFLESFRTDASVAVKFSYHTCFRNLGGDKTEQARVALINDSIMFCFELLMPRVYLDREKKINIDVCTYAKAQEVSRYLVEFSVEFAQYNKKLAQDCADRFFKKIAEIIKTHYFPVYNSYDKVLDKIKKSQDSEFRYYKNFLHHAIYGCALALEEIVPIGSVAERLKILRLGKQIIDEFLMLIDYKVEELEQSVKYSDVLDIFNEIDNGIEKLTSRK